MHGADWLTLGGVGRKWPEIGVGRAVLFKVCPLMSPRARGSEPLQETSRPGAHCSLQTQRTEVRTDRPL